MPPCPTGDIHVACHDSEYIFVTALLKTFALTRNWMLYKPYP
ncbi:hypothetical protein [Acinetobacter sp. H1(2024)]